ncbi:hypothetical protein G6F54_014363 [Rhizopus delemar]|nr:hypothetical protein G6F54_014363 [Rhizopus delemar]
MARELDDAILSMRTNELDIGTWILKTEGDADAVLAADAARQRHAGHWVAQPGPGGGQCGNRQQALRAGEALHFCHVLPIGGDPANRGAAQQQNA